MNEYELRQLMERIDRIDERLEVLETIILGKSQKQVVEQTPIQTDPIPIPDLVEEEIHVEPVSVQPVYEEPVEEPVYEEPMYEEPPVQREQEVVSANVNFDEVVPYSLREYVYFINGKIYAKQKLPKEMEDEFKTLADTINNR